ncbi:ABC transporter permease [Umezawaea tangerina]|uniref:ABC-2 type transport system permease protein n=1 Tax=Umezawaea tangerina TaxID=84725 RepID=A0A2T0TJA4_9PSEU|nr:ABC transporter permease [Umezawaea tangerina]PRY45804.1 ABC-2 type transport system permease protein [Umezawaea tangerina]
MTLLAVERIKLFSTRSPWWCMALAMVITIGMAALISANTDDRFPLTVSVSQGFSNFGMVVIMVMAALAVTTEYRFGTIRATFLAVPGRVQALLAKTAVVALLAGVVGEAVAFGSWGIGTLIKPDADMAINSSAEWRNVAGTGLVFALAAVLAVAVGVLVRQTAGAVAILLVYTMLVESLIGLIPTLGQKIQRWLPFQNSTNFQTAGNESFMNETGGLDYPFGPWGSLVYFAAICVGLLVVALVVAKRRDA